MMKRIRTFALPGLEVAAVWLVICMWHYAALGANNLANTQGFSLPSIVEWFIFSSRYRITVGFGLVVTFLVVMRTIYDTPAWRHAVSISMLLLLIFSSMAFTAFSVCTGGCLCDAWKEWGRHDHPTNSTLSAEGAPSVER